MAWKIKYFPGKGRVTPKKAAAHYKMSKTLICIAAMLFLLQGCDSELITPEPNQQLVVSQSQTIDSNLLITNTKFISITGSDAADGTLERPWKSLRYAITKVPANQGYAIQLSAGTFIETGLIEIPPGVSILGAGIDKTILKGASSFHYYPASPGYSLDKYLLRMNGTSPVNGNQVLRDFTIDGDFKKLHGGIYIRYRNAVTIENVKVQNTNFNGIWLWDVKDSKIQNSQIINSSWGNTSYCSGALNLGNLERVEINKLNVDESKGYGIKAIGPSGNNNLKTLIIHDSRISVHPYGLWKSGGAPNIAIELWQVNLVDCEIYNTYVDNTISLVNSNATPSTGIQTIRVHHNTIDIETRAKGAGYGIELSIHDAEIDHNYFLKGTNGIANWDHAMKNWSIHHNTFYGLEGTYPGEIVRSQKNGLHNVKLYNNTIEFIGTKTMNVVGIYGGSSNNVDIKNNLVINNATGQSYYPHKVIHLENGASVSSLTVKNNLFSRLPIGSVAGTYSSNLTSDPLIAKTGNRPDAYYQPKAGSPLINAGLNVNFPFVGSAPEIGAFETGETTTSPPTSTPVVSTPSGSAVKLYLDSSDALLGGKVTTGYDAIAKNGNYFYVPSGNGRNYLIPPPGTATFNFQIPKTDNYVIWAKVKAPSNSNQGYHVYDGNGRWIKWLAGVQTSWKWVKITENGTSTPFAFEQGANQFKMAWYDENVRVDQVMITNDLSFTP